MRRTSLIRILATGLAVSGVMTVAACEGGNLFSVQEPPLNGGGGDDAEAPTVEINSPRGDSLSAKPLGDSVFVSVRVADDVSLASVRFYGVAFRGDPNLGTDVVVQRFEEKVVAVDSTVSDTTLTRYLQAIPDETQETAFIIVEATDRVGNVGADTVNLILGGPEVELLDVVAGQSIQAGLTLNARVRATDPLGLVQVRLDITGAFERSVVLQVTPPQDSVVLDSVIPIPAGVVGPIQITAVARNNLDVAGQDGPITLNVIAAGAGDSIAPTLRQTEVASARLELQDSVQITVTGSDDNQGSGISRVGYTVLGISPAQGDTVIRSDERTFDPPRTGTVTATFRFTPFNVDSLNLPDTLTFEITSYMYDRDGNCAAAVGLEALQSLPCDTLAGGQIVAADRTGERITRSIVAGKTVRLPSGGVILDAVVDTVRQALLLSNIQENQVEVFRLDTESFGPAIGVGSEPWGMSLNQCPPLAPTAGCGDTLLVGNSGGTNISNVYLGPRTPGGTDVAGEDSNRRILTPDVVLFDIQLQEADDGSNSYAVSFIPTPDGVGFSDRPQFLARDSTGRVLYSTRVVETLDQVGTIRKAENRPGYVDPEVKIFLKHALLDDNEDNIAVGHADLVTGGSEVGVFDHIPGNLAAPLIQTSGEPVEALNAAQAAGSDLVFYPGKRWNVAQVGFQDTTFVTASGDGGWVAFGEGGAAVGRVIMYSAGADSITGSIPVADLMTNEGEEVRGIGLNYDGTMGVVRGSSQVSFFTPDLRLQGSPSLDISGGSGAVLHPLHANSQALTNTSGQYRPDTHLSFIGTSSGTIDIYDTFRFRRTGRLFIRDQVTGPLKAALPRPEDNVDEAGNPLQCTLKAVTDQAGRTIGSAVEIFQGGDFLSPWPADGGAGGSEDRCIVLKLYGTTSGGGVVIIDVRKSDVLRNHPARP